MAIAGLWDGFAPSCGLTPQLFTSEESRVPRGSREGAEREQDRGYFAGKHSGGVAWEAQ